MSKSEKALNAWAVYEYREHPQGLYHTCFVDGYTQGYEEAEKDLGWISVKDRLPEKDGWYLTCVRMEYLGNTPQIVCSLFFWKKYKRWEDADGLYNGKIDYWMEIPKLPEEEEK